MDSEASGAEYEVYMSFRGTDIRQGFADILYNHMDRAGIRVFRDENELAIGDKIDNILQAISNSSICIPIFSKKFAESKWCLDEVRKMVELNKDVLPVFYDVTPDDVGLNSPTYKQFMVEHENAYGKIKVEDWEHALKAIAKFKGQQVLNTSYTAFCKMFVGELLMKLKPRRRYELDNLVGIDNQLESAMKLLDIGACDVRYIVIHGMGGIGKTTLAKVIFDKFSTSFDNCGFLEDLQESLGRHSPDYLQKHLGDNLDPKSSTAFNLSRDIRQRFRGKKVLIVLDNIGSGEQVENLVGSSWFAPGSRIIITTRNKDVLNECANLEEEFIRSFEMSTLKHDEALQLFALYAFRKDSPPALYKNLSEEAVSTTGGLPLAIRIIASLLRGKNESVWRDVIARSRKIPHKDVKKRLKISYDSLDQDQQQIFLDITCFFTGTEQSNPRYMWEACDFYPTYGLEVLVSMSLVKITNENMLWMHDQLRDLGRDIVREENISNPMKQSRIWLQEDALKVLMGKGGKEAIEALSLRTTLVNILTDKHLASLKNIRFLELTGASFEGNSEDLLENLRWLSWHKCPKSFNLCLKNLVILDLSQSLIDENCTGWSLVQTANNLKVLDLRSCDNLTRTPNLTKVCTLERLILSGCSKLAIVDSSIGNLRRLKFLDLRDCHSLSSLPEELGSLEDLEEIFVDGNDGTFSLPNSIGNLKSLVSLTLDYLEINSIPDSIGGLTKLKHLSLRWCGIEEIPESFGNLESLVKMDLSFAGVRKLPNSIGGLIKLKELCLHSCGPIKELPDSVQCLTSLVRLDLSETKFCILPNSIGDLQELEVLNLTRCHIRSLPASIGRLKKLVELNADSCDFLEEVPQEIGGLSSLRRLSLSHTYICKLPPTIAQLSLLQELHLEGCGRLQELPELPPGLKNLTVSSNCLKKIHDLSKLDIISSLLITGTDDIEMTQKLAELKKLELHLSNATAAPFNLSSLSQLESLSLSIQPTDSTSSSPVISHGSTEIKLPCLSGLRNLLGVDCHNCLMEDGLESLGIRELESLKVAWVDKCSSKFIEVCLAKNLRSLSITDCESLKALPDLSHLHSLSDLDVMGCGELSEITGLEELPSLNTLSIIHCGSLERLGNISKLKKLWELYIDWCPRLTCIEGINELFIRDLTIINCEQWKWQ